MSTVVRARIDEKVKDDATAVLASIGLTVSDAFRLMMVRIAAEKRLLRAPGAQRRNHRGHASCPTRRRG